MQNIGTISIGFSNPLKLIPETTRDPQTSGYEQPSFRAQIFH